MNIITALGNEENCKKIKEKIDSDILGTDIQYKEAVIEILEKNNNINLLILSSILPGELNIYEFINIIKYKNPNLEIMIILEKEDNKLSEFIISKGIKYIFYNNKITFDEIILKINEIENKNKINNKIEKLEKIKLKENKKKIINNEKIKNKILKIKEKINKQKNRINNKKIISIIGAPKVGKTIFILILSLIIKNKKILILNCNIEKNDIPILIGKKKSKNEKIIKWKNNIDVMIVSKEIKKESFYEELDEKISKEMSKYDYIFFDIENIEENEEFIKKSNEIILLVEANLLGIKDAKDILVKLMKVTNNRKDNIKIVYNKYEITSIKEEILDVMFSDFKIIGKIQYDKNYNFFINTNTKFLTKKIREQYKKIEKKIV